MACDAKQNCGTCRFWGQETYFQSKLGEPEIETYCLFDTIGVCRRHAPSAEISRGLTGIGRGDILWPGTTHLDWCGEWAEKEKQDKPPKNPPMPTEWLVLEVANKLEDASKIEFRGIVERRHIRSSREAALWVCGWASKVHGVNLRDGQVAVSVRIDDGGYPTPAGVVDHLRHEGVLVIEHARCWDGHEKWGRVAEAFGLESRGPREHIQSLNNQIGSGELQSTPSLADHLRWVESWMRFHEWEKWESWQSDEQAKLDNLNESISHGEPQ